MLSVNSEMLAKILHDFGARRVLLPHRTILAVSRFVYTRHAAVACDLPSAVCHDQNGCAADGRRHETAKCYVLFRGVHLVPHTLIHPHELASPESM